MLKQSGVGQQSLLSQVQLTDLVYWLQSGKIVDVLRFSTEIHKLAFLLSHCLGHFVSCGSLPPGDGIRRSLRLLRIARCPQLPTSGCRRSSCCVALL